MWFYSNGYRVYSIRFEKTTSVFVFLVEHDFVFPPSASFCRTAFNFRTTSYDCGMSKPVSCSSTELSSFLPTLLSLGSRTLVAKASNTCQGPLYVVRFSRDGVSGDLFETRPSLGVMFYFLSPRMESRGIWLQSEAFLLVEGLKGPLSTQFTLLQLQTGDASFSATAQNIESKGGVRLHWNRE